ncbi:hypothetical protein [Pseudobacillus wudalianchiensis]|uniref:Uncharacterized protein n=1 Tax=Pseudobacillus wudalianchiensis TaxID=1743143 RepID=A0A1B9AN33_9BACI|nr:hypothetical protein [Bacillus wudalianchiensis]OCA85216.1 hypothetical protein A8F95_11110 [Bacillus wudalianchiensis]
MPLILFTKETETRARVDVIHYVTEGLPKETIDLGVMVDLVPEPEDIQGKGYTMLFNPSTKEVWYEYYDRPLSPEEELVQIKQKNRELEASLLEMSMLAANQEQRNIQNEKAIIELTTIIAGGNA